MNTIDITIIIMGIAGGVLMLMLFKGVLVSSAGPAPNYDMQKILAARNPREASLMSWFVSLALCGCFQVTTERIYQATPRN